MFHYVYRITNKTSKIHYYGCRSSKISPNEDIGKKYFSSSRDKKFIEEQIDNPHIFRYKVVFVFDCRKNALLREIALHKRFNVCSNEKFYNKSNQTSDKFNTSNTLVDSKWMNNGINQIQVIGSEIQNYLNNGWIFKRLPTNAYKDLCSIHKNSTIKRVKEDKINHYLELGWSLGSGIAGPNSGKVAIQKENFGTKNVNKNDLNEFLDSGWSLGRGFNPTEGLIWFNKDGIIKGARPDEIEEFLKDGWLRGTGISSVLGSVSVKHQAMGEKKIKKELLEDYLNQGWVLGSNNIGPHGKILMYSGTTQMWVAKEKREEFEKDGWVKGRVIRPTKGFVYINKEGKEKLINKTLLDDYLVLGWISGRKKKTKQD